MTSSCSFSQSKLRKDSLPLVWPAFLHGNSAVAVTSLWYCSCQNHQTSKIWAEQVLALVHIQLICKNQKDRQIETLLKALPRPMACKNRNRTPLRVSTQHTVCKNSNRTPAGIGRSIRRRHGKANTSRVNACQTSEQAWTGISTLLLRLRQPGEARSMERKSRAHLQFGLRIDPLTYLDPGLSLSRNVTVSGCRLSAIWQRKSALAAVSGNEGGQFSCHG